MMEKYYQYKGVRYYVKDIHHSSTDRMYKMATAIDTLRDIDGKESYSVKFGVCRRTSNEACIALEMNIDDELSKGKKVIRKE